MDSSAETNKQDDNSPFPPHPTDPDGVLMPPPTPQQMAQGRLLCKVYNREEWGGRPPRETPVMYTPVTKVVLSRTETDPCFTHEDCRFQIKRLQSIHMDEEGEPDIKYHFLVGGDGALYEGRGYTTAGASYPASPNNLQDLSKSCLEIAFIQNSDQKTTEEMQEVASDCITLGRHANHIHKTFDLYFVVHNDIVHSEKMGTRKGEENKTDPDKEKPGTINEVDRQSTSSELNVGEPKAESSDDKKPMDSQGRATENKDSSFELEVEKDETGRSKLLETETIDFPTSSHVPLHDSPTDEKSEEKPEVKMKPVNFIYRHVWGAQMPKRIKALNLPINKVAVSFTESEPCFTQDECIAAVKQLQAQHLEETDEDDIRHNFLIGGDGQIYEGRGYTRVGPIYPPSSRKIEDLVGKSIDIGIIERHASTPSEKVIEALSWCISNGIHERYIEKNFDTYYIANNEIIHIQHPVAGAQHKT